MLTLSSPAKINLTLEVLSKRPDGYHEVRTLMQTVDLCDSITIEELPKARSLEIHVDKMSCPTDERNLVWQAIHWLRESTGFDVGLSVTIEKRIPIGGGLGGGSSNGAAVLLTVANQYGLLVDGESLLEIASRLGSDVPFFLLGGTAQATGRGEIIEPVADLPASLFVLCSPGVSTETARVYSSSVLSRSLKRKRDHAVNVTEEFLSAIGTEDRWKYMVNELQPSALSLYPGIGKMLDLLLEMGAPRPLLTGSGSTVFTPVASREQAELVVAKMRTAGFWATSVESVAREAYRKLVLGT